jgi:hypothetical protein
MHILITHTIVEPQKFFATGANLTSRAPNGLRARCFLPTADATRAVCVWESPSVAALREYIDGALGAASTNEYHELDVGHSLGLPG